MRLTDHCIKHGELTQTLIIMNSSAYARPMTPCVTLVVYMALTKKFKHLIGRLQMSIDIYSNMFN